MNSVNKQLLEQVEHLLTEAQNIISSAVETEEGIPDINDLFDSHPSYPYQQPVAPKKLFIRQVYDEPRILALGASIKSFALRLYKDREHPRYTLLSALGRDDSLQYLENVKAILLSIKTDIEKGWLIPFSELVSAEIFSDSLEAAKHILNEGYKDAAAVMIGSTLESHLRELAKNTDGIEVVNDKGKLISGGALNQKLGETGVLNASTVKAVTFYLDTRNHAAHGHYEKYTSEQVELMYQGVVLFLNQTQQAGG